MSRDIVQLLPELFALCGQEIGVSDWKLIDQNSIDKFSALTGDAGPIHNDPEVSKQIAPFGGTIVQGFMMLSCLTGFAKNLHLPQGNVAYRLNYGFNKVRIITPVPVNSRIRGRFSMHNLEARGESGALMALEVVVEVKGTNDPALVAEWLAYLQLSPSTSE
ncbi:MAG: MaoC family dehydratase [SAR86 cluster bacterium]|jgi:acyl dehydratase|nr:MaoC family dehydratase [SAR86 cluster bacterium]